jgi:hypothetical protein
MSDVGQLPAMSAAMTAALAAMKAAQQMAASSALPVENAKVASDGRTPLPYSRFLDKLS